MYISLFGSMIAFNMGCMLIEMFVNTRMTFKRYIKRFVFKVFKKKIWLNNNEKPKEVKTVDSPQETDNDSPNILLLKGESARLSSHS